MTSNLPSPPTSPFWEDELPAILTDERGMVVDSNDASGSSNEKKSQAVKQKKAPVKHPKRQPIKYVSRHFSRAGGEEGEDCRPTRNNDAGSNRNNAASPEPISVIATPPQTPAKNIPSTDPRVLYSLNVDDLSSDSDLTDIPQDIGPDPFRIPSLKPSHSRNPAKLTGKKRNPTKSPFFPSPHKHRPTFLSTLPFPPISASKFGLMQEILATDPFRLLVATIFLNKTPGERAMPVFFQLMKKYPAPADLAEADVVDVTTIIHHLGFQNQRARKCVSMAKMWVERPPEKGKRFKKLNYPTKGDGKDIKEQGTISDCDERVGWEISHLSGIGAYGHDSWRMFCRDTLRGVAQGWNGEGSNVPNFEPEWKRVLPLDKELRAWITWMWMKEGWVWNKETGYRTRASKELMDMANSGGIVVEEREKETLTVQAADQERLKTKSWEGSLARPAGQILEIAEDFKLQV